VVPRIQDLTALQAELAELVPTVQVVAAHGRMAPEALQAGLDIPRANLVAVRARTASGWRSCTSCAAGSDAGRGGARRIC
jgi:hypothetical protein